MVAMTANDLKKLSRMDLLELLIARSEEVEKLQALLKDAEEKLNQREIILKEAGSIAEASLRLNGIFEAAQSASRQYLDSIQLYLDYQKLVCEKMEQRIKEEAEQSLENTRKKCEQMETETKYKCTEMLLRAKIESQEYWDSVSEKLELYYAKNPELRGVLWEDMPKLPPLEADEQEKSRRI